MKTNDLSNKKINNEQKVNEGFSGNNLPGDYDPAATKLEQELETNEEGEEKVVFRGRHKEEAPEKTDTGIDHNQSMKAIENKDRNSDIATNRYPNAHPDNQHNRGNIRLDE